MLLHVGGGGESSSLPMVRVMVNFCRGGQGAKLKGVGSLKGRVGTERC